MAKTPCAVFWDIQNIGVPRGQSAASIVSLVRSSIINLYNLREIYFYCVADVTKLPATVGNPLTNQDVNIIQAYDYKKDSADIKILDLMRKFVENQGKTGCAIILLSGDGDYAGTLIDLKKLYNITIFVVGLVTSFSIKLEAAANYTFRLINGELEHVKSFRFPQFFVSFSRFPISKGLNRIRMELNKLTKPFGSIDGSAIDYENEVIVGFPSLELARRAAARFNASRFLGTFLKADILQHPSSEILLKVQNSWPPPPSPPNRCSPLRSSFNRKKFSRRSNKNNKKRQVPDCHSSMEKLRRTLAQDFIAMTISDRTVITDCTVTSSTSKSKNLLINKKKPQNTEKPNSNGWASFYSQSTNIKSPTLIDLTQSPFPPHRRPTKQSSSSSSEPIVVDLTEDS